MDAACRVSLFIISSRSLLKFMSTEPVMPSHSLIHYHPFSCPRSFPALWSFPISSLHYLAKILELQLQQQSFQCIYRVDFLWNLLVWSPCCSRDSQESSSAPQFEGISSLVISSIMVQLPHPYMTSGKNIPLTIWTFFREVMSLLFNILKRQRNQRSNYQHPLDHR